uniref:SFRICE_019494 n=1 Tax=Spodoptera frugiperda TaxID=7108 RepID=A0A2H1W5H3_SPOFR
MVLFDSSNFVFSSVMLSFRDVISSKALAISTVMGGGNLDRSFATKMGKSFRLIFFIKIIISFRIFSVLSGQRHGMSLYFPTALNSRYLARFASSVVKADLQVCKMLALSNRRSMAACFKNANTSLTISGSELIVINTCSGYGRASREQTIRYKQRTHKGMAVDMTSGCDVIDRDIAPQPSMQSRLRWRAR